MSMRLYRMRWLADDVAPGTPGYRAWVTLPHGVTVYREVSAMPWEGSDALVTLRDQLQADCVRLGYNDAVITYRTEEDCDNAERCDDGTFVRRP